MSLTFRTQRTILSRATASVLALTMALGAGAADAETLAEALALAYQTNPQLQSQRAAQRALDETYVRARAGYGLNLSAQAGYTHRDVELANGNRVSDNTDNITLQLSQPLYTGGRVAARVNAAEATVEAGRQRLRRVEQETLLNVISAYTAVRRDAQILQLVSDSVTLLERQLEETEAKFNVRQLTRTDMAQAESRLASARSQLAEARAQLEITRNLYLEVVGQNPEDLAPEPDLVAVPATLEAALDAGEANSPQLLESRFAEAASRERVAEARAAFAPSVALRLDAGRASSEQNTQNIYPETFTASAVVSQPLFTGGLNRSELRRALEQHNADALAVEANRRTVIREVSQAWSRLVGARQALTTDQQAAQAGQTAFFGMREEERFGLRSTIEVLNAQQELISSQTRLVRQQANEYVARAALLQAAGLLEAETLLGPGFDTYDPEDNFRRVRNKGSLPWEHLIRAVDDIASPPPAAPKPVTDAPAPAVQPELPPAPAAAADRAPLRSTVDIMRETQMRPEPEDAPPPPPPPPPSARRPAGES
jgi:TolC family type I secretion outer membrane protein